MATAASRVTTVAEEPTANEDDPLTNLIRLVEFSKKHPNQFDWKKNLNEWQILFVDYIVQVARHVPGMKLTPKQQDKAIECVARMTLV